MIRDRVIKKRCPEYCAKRISCSIAVATKQAAQQTAREACGEAALLTARAATALHAWRGGKDA